jgi:uncharacterized membrane protein YfhO
MGGQPAIGFLSPKITSGLILHSYRANYLLRAVAIQAGNHHLEFRYRPRSFQVGALFTLSALSGILLVLWRDWRRSSYLAKVVSIFAK